MYYLSFVIFEYIQHHILFLPNDSNKKNSDDGVLNGINNMFLVFF